MRRLKNKPWFNYAAALCIAVVLYVVLTHIPGLRKGIRTFLGYFKPVILGCVIAYVINSLSNLYERSVFRWIKKEVPREAASIVLAFVTVLLLLTLLMLLLIPQLVDSIRLFVFNLDGYAEAVNSFLDRLGISASALGIDGVIGSSETIIDTVTDYLRNNLNAILTKSVHAGKSIVQFLIAFMLSIYLIAAKRRLRDGGKRLLRAVTSDEGYARSRRFFVKSHAILNRYIAFNLLDSLIIGAVNAVFMTALGMPYVGLVSFVVAVTNLVPTFGPIVGVGIGAFILVLVKPWYALAFLIFTVVLQGVDGYLIKPKLFGESLGVSGLWILIGVIVGGRMFGIIGILLAIPGVAILDMLYKEYLLPKLEARRLRVEIPPAE
ncbi:MAG: AI-2E family transporter [Clostridia bacterium]|nr:AI-2E family transporter [Clostridia bacterium]